MKYRKTEKQKYVDVLYPIRELLEINETVKKIKCPNPDHLDRHPSAMIKGNKCYCFTCCRFFLSSDIAEYSGKDISELYESLQKEYGNELKEIYNELEEKEEVKMKEVIEVDIEGKSLTEFTKEFFKNNADT